MIKREFAKIIAKKHGLTNDKALEIFESFAAEIKAAVLDRGEVFRVQNLGVFSRRYTSAKTVVNASKGEKYQIPARLRVGFTCSKSCKREATP